MSGMTMSIKEQWQKPRRALKEQQEGRCHSEARPQPEKKKAVGALMEDRRRQSVAFGEW